MRGGGGGGGDGVWRECVWRQSTDSGDHTMRTAMHSLSGDNAMMLLVMLHCAQD